ncbi:sugar ABC transporter substrate-binding protein [Streptomyces luteolifulvus]|jgi:multiple sugar transport system substrate-binding protein|uniref:Sugar ABC transporter substrate-binding protein n=1 Tax=Streptomyces luteolifulvus TaxID=2615112 RepID=A0A6H9V827_9ACTN|nr:sugar ABC transporter substrate-binding protein [Streptomyces luteolifulvus]KAB1150035.1 sugar ABC transporter substrate-binding protein [Streptomyces luteolifulvus]
MRRRTAALALGTAAATILAGCSTMSPDASGTVTLNMVESLTNPARTDLLKDLIADFERQHPKVKVNLISPPTEQADQKLQQMLQSGSGVDVLEVRDITVGPWSNNGWLYDMNKDLDGWKGWQALTENAVNASKDAKGRTYFIPYGFYGLSLFYRTDLIKKAGFSKPPATWEELLQQASAINQPATRRYGYAFRGGANAHSNATAVIEAYVADQVDPANGYRLRSGRTIFSAPEAEDALATYLQLFEQASPKSSVAWGYPEMVEAFSNGSTAFLLQDPEVIATVSQSKAISTRQWSTAPLVAGPGGKTVQPLATAGWGVAKGSGHKEAAVDLVEFLSQGEASTNFTKKNSLVPILKSATGDPFYRTGPWASYVTMTEHPEKYLVVTQPRGVAWWTEWQQKADTDVQKMILGKTKPKELLAGWDAYWTEKWQQEQ